MLFSETLEKIDQRLYSDINHAHLKNSYEKVSKVNEIIYERPLDTS